MISQDLSDLQRDATKWWRGLEDDQIRTIYAKKYIGTSDIKTLTHLEIMYSYLSILNKVINSLIITILPARPEGMCSSLYTLSNIVAIYLKKI